MSTKTTLLLIALAGLLLGFIALYERKQPKSWQAADRERYVLLFDRNSVEGIDIFSNEDKVQLRKRGSQWVMEAPVKDRADTKAIQEILARCEALQREPGSLVADKQQLKAFGVNKSSIRLKLLGPDMPATLLFGKETAVEGKMYVRLEGTNNVSIAGTDLRNGIVRKPDEFRDPQLADFDSAEVAKVAVKTAAGEIGLAMEGGRWGVVKPLHARADDVRVTAFLNSVLHTQIAVFLPENSANLNSYGLSEPRGTVTFTRLHNPQPVVLEIGARDEKTGGVYARFSNRSAVCLLPKESENILSLHPNALRDQRLLRLDLDYVDRITLQPAGHVPILLQRNREEWILRGQNAPANKAKVLQFVKELQTRKIEAFVTDIASDLEKYGFDQPQLRVTFSSYASENTAEANAGEMPILTLAFGKTEGEIVYARLEDETFIVSVDRSALSEISVNAVEWRALSLFHFKPSEITTLEVTHLSDGIPRVSLAFKENQWIAEEGSTPGKLNPVNIQSLVNTLAALKAMQWTAEAGPLVASEVLEFKDAHGKSHKVLLGAPASDGSCLGMIDGDTGVFRLAAPDASALRLPLVAPE
ncbi:MAG: DUF4340 domain-containing protein [Verrucomicrobia bacterium]|nr:DUF4340 domain-containing protein [Verrucomicrobiota bacterium]